MEWKEVACLFKILLSEISLSKEASWILSERSWVVYSYFLHTQRSVVSDTFYDCTDTLLPPSTAVMLVFV